MAEASTVSRRALDEGYEPEDIRVRGVLIVAGASLVLLALVFLALWAMLRLFAESYRDPCRPGSSARASSRRRRVCNRRRRTT